MITFENGTDMSLALLSLQGDGGTATVNNVAFFREDGVAVPGNGADDVWDIAATTTKKTLAELWEAAHPTLDKFQDYLSNNRVVGMASLAAVSGSGLKIFSGALTGTPIKTVPVAGFLAWGRLPKEVLAYGGGTNTTVTTTASILAEYDEDSAAAGGSKGVAILGKRTDVPATQTSADYDWSHLVVNENGELVVAIRGDLAPTAAAQVLSSASFVDIPTNGADWIVLQLACADWGGEVLTYQVLAGTTGEDYQGFTIDEFRGQIKEMNKGGSFSSGTFRVLVPTSGATGIRVASASYTSGSVSIQGFRANAPSNAMVTAMGRSMTSEPSLRTSHQTTPILLTPTGAVVVRPHCHRALTWTALLGVLTTAASASSVKSAPGLGLRFMVTNIELNNSGATDALVTLSDTSGNFWQIELKAGQGISSKPEVPISLAQNSGIFITISAATRISGTIVGFTTAE